MDKITSRACKRLFTWGCARYGWTDELGLFLKTLPQKGLIEKGIKGRDGNQS